MPNTQPEPRMQCRHVFTDGHRCASPCLRHEDFCYYHHTSRRPVSNPAARRRRGTTFVLPELEDRASIQLALSEILQRIASNDLDPKRAGHLLYGLQIAISLLPKLDPKAKTQPTSVADITHDVELGDLAPAAQVGHDKEPSEWDEILARFEEIRNRKPEDQLAPNPAPKPFDLNTIASLDAVAEEVCQKHEKLLLQPRVSTRYTTFLRGPHALKLSLLRRRCPALAPRHRGPAARRRRP